LSQRNTGSKNILNIHYNLDHLQKEVVILDFGLRCRLSWKQLLSEILHDEMDNHNLWEMKACKLLICCLNFCKL